jgi:hypothetical protein
MFIKFAKLLEELLEELLEIIRRNFLDGIYKKKIPDSFEIQMIF